MTEPATAAAHNLEHGSDVIKVTTTVTAAVSESAYRTALILIDEGTRSLARCYKDLGSSTWKARLLPGEHADLTLRLARVLTVEEAEGA